MWTSWSVVQILLMALGLLLVFGGNRLAMPILLHAGIVCLGLGIIVMGVEAILKRRLIRYRRGRPREAYTGIPAILQGVQLNFIGLFLIGAALMMQFNNGREIFQQLARRPGMFLLLLGGLCFLQTLIMLLGSGKAHESSPGLRIVVLVLGRLFPGIIWLVLGLGLFVLGMFDILAPTMFDEMGGKFLEGLY